jgi:hypothetical protein
MPVIRDSIAVEAPVDVVSDAWQYFIDWVLVGERKMLCSELACVRAAHDGHVNFESLDPQRTTVAFELAPDGAGIADEVLAHRLRQDLLLFKEYVEEEHLGSRERKRLEQARRVTDPQRSQEKPPPQPSDADHVSNRPARTVI